eukprot:TRINITY_DN1780_c0_g1_i10.p1 TRINITY_DN1780_c0_g1~~TRINITY_DN1780_c0_g1_i10.p1  ORF type:complete len:184 (+),score=47.33 TRINITY_DN1780_c0_g1_i10:48-554(+)
MIDSVRKNDDLLVLMCKDARAITLQVCSADILRQFFQTVRTLSEPSCVEDIFAFEMGNHSKEINEQPIYDTREYFVNLLRDFVNENHQPVWYISDINRDYTVCSEILRLGGSVRPEITWGGSIGDWVVTWKRKSRVTLKSNFDFSQPTKRKKSEKINDLGTNVIGGSE